VAGKLRNEIDNGSIASWDVPTVQLFQRGESGCWASPFRLATKVVKIELPIWRTSQILMRNICPQKMRDRKCLVLPPGAKVGILAIFNTRDIVMFLIVPWV